MEDIIVKGYEVTASLMFLSGSHWMGQGLDGDGKIFDHRPSAAELADLHEMVTDYYFPEGAPEDQYIRLNVSELTIPADEPPAGRTWNVYREIVEEYDG